MSDDIEYADIDPERLEELISSVAELNNISEALADDRVNQVLGVIVSLMENPNLPPKVAAGLVVSLTAASFSFNLRAKNYIKFDNTNANKTKKDFYFSLADGCDKLAQALKYLVKLGAI